MRVRIENALLASLFMAGLACAVVLTKGLITLLVAVCVVYCVISDVRKDNTK